MDESPPTFVIDKIKKIVLTVSGIEKVTSLKVRKSGPYLYVDVEIEINQYMTVKISHNIAETVKHDLINSNLYINEVMVHINPYEG